MIKIWSSLFIAALFSANSFAYTVSVQEVDTILPCVIDCVGKPGDTKPGDTKPGDTKPTTSTAATNASPAPGGDGTDGSGTDTTPGPISTGEPPASKLPTLDEIFSVVDHITTIGNKVWDFVVSRAPNATYNTLKASVVPAGVTDWRQLTGWSRPVAKTFRVTFRDLRGNIAGGFDYRISFITGGGHKGKGQFIGEIGVAPDNISLKTDRSVNFHAEVLDPINFGTEENPIAGVQVLITYSSPTTLRYTMHSDEYYVYGTGEFQKISK